MPIREKTVEDYLVARVSALGGVADKVTSPSARGYFDRVVVLPGGRIIFCELKKPKGGHISPHQHDRHATYRRLGAEVAVVRSYIDVDFMLSAGVHQRAAAP